MVQYEGAGLTAARFLHADRQGSVIAHGDPGGTLASLNSYDEYGVAAGPSAGRFGYTGQATLYEVGVNYYKARMYSPPLGVFLQADPVGYEDGANLYAYVGGDPINLVDRSGKRIVVLAHEVQYRGYKTGQFHLKLAIIPNNQAAYRNDSRFQRNSAGAMVATLGAGPENRRPERILGDLVSEPNRGNDRSEKSILVADILPGKGDTEDSLISRIFEADTNYGDGLQYDFFPDASSDGYNSNSYITGLLGAIGVDKVPLPDQAIAPTPGAEKPVPVECFRVGGSRC